MLIWWKTAWKQVQLIHGVSNCSIDYICPITTEMHNRVLMICTTTHTILTFTVRRSEATCTGTSAGSWIQCPSILTHPTTSCGRGKRKSRLECSTWVTWILILHNYMFCTHNLCPVAQPTIPLCTEIHNRCAVIQWGLTQRTTGYLKGTPDEKKLHSAIGSTFCQILRHSAFCNLLYCLIQ